MSITKDLFEFAKRDSDGLYSLSISENGKTETFKRILANDTNNVFSVSKVFTVTAIGFLVDDGLLSLDEKFSDIFAAEMPDGYDKKWDSVTVDNVIKHKVGFNEGFLDIDVEDVAGYEQKYGTRTDFLKIVLSHNIYFEPGTQFCYSDAAYYLLSRVVTKKSGERLDDFLNSRLFVPLCFSEVAWSHCPQGFPMGATGLYIRTNDMVKVAQLYLNRGMYEGRRYFSEDWYNTVIERGYEFSRCGMYGYGKGGLYGQFIYFNTKLGIAVGWEGHENSAYSGRLMDYLLTLEKE